MDGMRVKVECFKVILFQGCFDKNTEVQLYSLACCLLTIQWVRGQ